MTYDPAMLRRDEWRAFRQHFGAGAAAALDDADFLDAFATAWAPAPLFSHFELRRSGAIIDEIRKADLAAEQAPVATFEKITDTVGIIKISSFFGDRIAEKINAVFDDAMKANVRGLIVDLRGNRGGTIAAWPLAARTFSEERIAGYFIAAPWWNAHDVAPDPDLVDRTASPPAVTSEAYAADLFEDGLAVMRFAPVPPIFDGPVVILVDEVSASTSEVMAGALQHLGRASVIGRRTAGEVLNANLFPLAEGYSLLLPVADFRLADGSRLEGVGVTPDIVTSPDEDIACALESLRVGNRRSGTETNENPGCPSS
jgi:carboxyl-terminal processing protease